MSVLIWLRESMSASVHLCVWRLRIAQKFYRTSHNIKSHVKCYTLVECDTQLYHKNLLKDTGFIKVVLGEGWGLGIELVQGYG